MVAAISLVAFVIVVAAIAWATRKAKRKPTCCNPGQWPPDDITGRSG